MSGMFVEVPFILGIVWHVADFCKQVDALQGARPIEKEIYIFFESFGRFYFPALF